MFLIFEIEIERERERKRYELTFEREYGMAIFYLRLEKSRIMRHDSKERDQSIFDESH